MLFVCSKLSWFVFIFAPLVITVGAERQHPYHQHVNNLLRAHGSSAHLVHRLPRTAAVRHQPAVVQEDKKPAGHFFPEDAWSISHVPEQLKIGFDIYRNYTEKKVQYVTFESVRMTNKIIIEYSLESSGEGQRCKYPENADLPMKDRLLFEANRKDVLKENMDALLPTPPESTSEASFLQITNSMADNGKPVDAAQLQSTKEAAARTRAQAEIDKEQSAKKVAEHLKTYRGQIEKRYNTHDQDTGANVIRTKLQTEEEENKELIWEKPWEIALEMSIDGGANWMPLEIPEESNVTSSIVHRTIHLPPMLVQASKARPDVPSKVKYRLTQKMDDCSCCSDLFVRSFSPED